MGEFSQIQRLLRILQILSSGRKVTTTELLHRFDGRVSLRTLQRDLLALSEAGIPLISEKTMANENAWTLMSRFRSFIPMPLETNEYLAAHILKANLKIFQLILNLLLWSFLISMAIDRFRRIYWHIKTILDDPKHFFFFQISWTNKSINF